MTSCHLQCGVGLADVCNRIQNIHAGHDKNVGLMCRHCGKACEYSYLAILGCKINRMENACRLAVKGYVG